MSDFGFASWLGLSPSSHAAPQAPPASSHAVAQDASEASDSTPARIPQQRQLSTPQPSSANNTGAPKVAASDALAAAIAKGSSSGPKIEPKGMVLPPSGAMFDVDAVPQSAIQQLRVMTVTKVHTDYRDRHLNQIASNASYITYGLKQGHIRLLSKETANPALLKGHSTMVTDMQFCAASNMLASCDATGTVHVRSITEADQALQDEMLFSQAFGANDAATRRLSWHPELENLLAVAATDRVAFVNVPPTIGVASFPEFSQPVTPSGPQTPGLITCVAFSRKGDLLAASDDQGSVHVWVLPPDFSTRPKYEALSCTADLTFKAYDTAGAWPAVLDFLPSSGHTQVLVTGDQTCAALALWRLRPTTDSSAGGAKLEVECTYRLQVSSAEGVFNHMVVLPTLSALVLANTKKQQVYVLHGHQDPSDGKASFDYVSTFSVMMPILSLTSSTEGVTQDVAGADIFRLYTVQTEAIQEYTLYASACFPAADLEEESARQQQLYLEAHTHNNTMHPVIPPTVHVPQLSPADTPGTPQRPQQQPSPSEPAPQPVEAIEASGSGPSTPDGSGQPADALAVERLAAAVPARVSFGGASDRGISSPPPPPPPLGVLQAAGRATSSPEPIAIAVTPIPAPRPPQPTTTQVAARPDSPGSTDSDATSPAPPIRATHAPARAPSPTPAVTPSLAEAHTSGGGASAPTPVLHASVGGGELPSAGSTGSTGGAGPVRVEELPTQAADSTPFTAAAKHTTPIFTGAAAASLAQPQPSGGSGDEGATEAARPGQRPARRQRTKHTGVRPRVDTTPGSTGASAGGSGAPAAGPPPPSPHLLQRSSKPLPPVGSSPTNSAMDLAEGGGESTPAPVHVPAPVPSDNGTSQRAARNGPVPAMQELLACEGDSGAAAGASTGGVPAGKAATGAAVDGLLDVGTVQALLAQMTALHRESVRQLKADLRAEIKQSQRAHEATLKQLLEAQSKVAEDAQDKVAQLLDAQAKVVEKRDREEVARGVAGAVQALSRDLGGRLAEMQRTLPGQVATTATSAVRSAIAEALPTAAQQAVDKAVDRAVKSVLPKALSEALRETLSTTLIPAFERATQVMFGQVEQVLSAGLTSHLSAAQEASEAVKALGSQVSLACLSLEGEVAALSGVSAGIVARAASASVTAPAPEPPSPRSPEQLIQEHLASKSFDAAFSVALSSGGQERLTALMRQVSPQTVLGVPCLLSQGVILSLLSHLAASLDKETETKLHWITEAGNSLDVLDPHTAPHARMILEPLKRTLTQLALSQGGEIGRLAKTAVHVINSLLHMTAEGTK